MKPKCCRGLWVVHVTESKKNHWGKDLNITINGPFTCRIRAELFAANVAGNIQWGTTVKVEEA